MGISALATDGYKFSMAEAGWPLRVETFHYTHRKGGPQVVPLDVERFLRALLPSVDGAARRAAESVGYEPGSGCWEALRRHDALRIRALPKGAILYPGEPLFTATGPSALVSWIEPLALQLAFRMQVATLALTDRAGLERAVSVATCAKEKEILLETLDAVGVRAPRIEVDSDGYREQVFAQAAAIVKVVEDPSRLFEVGLRSASCLEQHLIALEGCRTAGWSRTSNVLGASELGLVAVGTMGHEHVQRYGSDEAAFRAMRDRRPGRSSYLLDTFDALRSGIPAAFRLLEESPARGDSIRYDSGDIEAQYRIGTAEAIRRGIRPVQIIEDGLDLEATVRLETVRKELGWRPEEQFYGYGGFVVARTAPSGLTRDRVGAVYKLSETGGRPTMKLADPAKRSLPGRPEVFRRVRGDGPVGIIGQEGEPAPEGYVRLTGAEAGPLPHSVLDGPFEVVHGPATRALVGRLERERQEAIASWN